MGKIKPEASSGRSQPGDPTRGNLNSWALKALCTILTRHTRTPQTCYLAVWEGWGWLHDDGSPASTITAYYAPGGVMPDVRPPQPAPAEWRLDTRGPTFSLPGRRYHLFADHLHSAARIGDWVNEDWFIPQSPSFF